MENNPMAGLVEGMARLDVPIATEEVVSTLRSSGWSSDLADASPVPQEWESGENSLSLYSEDGEWAFIDFCLRAIPPEWDDPEYSDAVNDDYAKESEEVQRAAVAIIRELDSHGAPPVPVNENPEEEYGIFDASCWQAGGIYITAGISHPDVEDTPILLIIRLRQADR